MVLLIFLDYQLTGRLRLIVHGPAGEGCGSTHTWSCHYNYYIGKLKGTVGVISIDPFDHIKERYTTAPFKSLSEQT